MKIINVESYDGDWKNGLFGGKGVLFFRKLI